MQSLLKPAILSTSASVLLAVETGLFVGCTVHACLRKTRRQTYPSEVRQACGRVNAIIRCIFVDERQSGTAGRHFLCFARLYP